MSTIILWWSCMEADAAWHAQFVYGDDDESWTYNTMSLGDTTVDVQLLLTELVFGDDPDVDDAAYRNNSVLLMRAFDLLQRHQVADANSPAIRIAARANFSREADVFEHLERRRRNRNVTWFEDAPTLDADARLRPLTSYHGGIVVGQTANNTSAVRFVPGDSVRVNYVYWTDSPPGESFDIDAYQRGLAQLTVGTLCTCVFHDAFTAAATGLKRLRGSAKVLHASPEDAILSVGNRKLRVSKTDASSNPCWVFADGDALPRIGKCDVLRHKFFSTRMDLSQVRRFCVPSTSRESHTWNAVNHAHRVVASEPRSYDVAHVEDTVATRSIVARRGDRVDTASRDDTSWSAFVKAVVGSGKLSNKRSVKRSRKSSVSPRLIWTDADTDAYADADALNHEPVHLDYPMWIAKRAVWQDVSWKKHLRVRTSSFLSAVDASHLRSDVPVSDITRPVDMSVPSNSWIRSPYDSQPSEKVFVDMFHLYEMQVSRFFVRSDEQGTWVRPVDDGLTDVMHADVGDDHSIDQEDNDGPEMEYLVDDSDDARRMKSIVADVVLRLSGLRSDVVAHVHKLDVTGVENTFLQRDFVVKSWWRFAQQIARSGLAKLEAVRSRAKNKRQYASLIDDHLVSTGEEMFAHGCYLIAALVDIAMSSLPTAKPGAEVVRGLLGTRHPVTSAAAVFSARVSRYVNQLKKTKRDTFDAFAKQVHMRGSDVLETRSVTVEFTDAPVPRVRGALRMRASSSSNVMSPDVPAPRSKTNDTETIAVAGRRVWAPERIVPVPGRVEDAKRAARIHADILEFLVRIRAVDDATRKTFVRVTSRDIDVGCAALFDVVAYHVPYFVTGPDVTRSEPSRERVARACIETKRRVEHVGDVGERVAVLMDGLLRAYDAAAGQTKSLVVSMETTPLVRELAVSVYRRVAEF